MLNRLCVQILKWRVLTLEQVEASLKIQGRLYFDLQIKMKVVRHQVITFYVFFLV